MGAFGPGMRSIAGGVRGHPHNVPEAQALQVALPDLHYCSHASQCQQTPEERTVGALGKLSCPYHTKNQCQCRWLYLNL